VKGCGESVATLSLELCADKKDVGGIFTIASRRRHLAQVEIRARKHSMNPLGGNPEIIDKRHPKPIAEGKDSSCPVIDLRFAINDLLELLIFEKTAVRKAAMPTVDRDLYIGVAAEKVRQGARKRRERGADLQPAIRPLKVSVYLSASAHAPDLEGHRSQSEACSPF
jgi:hypothetical protein